MARGVLTAQVTGRTGTRTITYTPADAVNHHQFSNADGKSILLVKNGGGSAVTVTITPALTIDGVTLGVITVSVGAGADAIIGPFPTSVYNQPGDVVFLNLSSATSVTLAVLKVGA